jgi:hypothetical protein
MQFARNYFLRAGQFLKSAGKTRGIEKAKRLMEGECGIEALKKNQSHTE